MNVPLKEWEKNLTLKPNQIILIKYSVVAKKEKEKITLPQISVTYEKDGGIIKENSNLNHHYVCNWNKKVILIGKQYEKIIQDFSNECQKKFCSLLVYGTGGTGKTRILEECKCQLIKKNYNIINFIGFDNTYICEYLYPRLSSIAQPIEEMAALTVQRLIHRLDHPDDKSVIDHPLHAELISRESSLRKRGEK